MTQPGGNEPARRDPDLPSRRELLSSPLSQLGGRGHRRRERIVEEILANRRGEYRVPTWVLAAALVLIVGAFTLWLLLL